MLKVAIVGLGKMGQRHLQKWSQLDGCEVVGLVSSDQDKLANYDTKGFSKLEDLLANIDVDVVDICLPTHLHYDYVKQVAEAKKHVICEKPLAMNVEQTEEMIDLCQKHNVQLYVGQTMRFSPEYVNAHQQVENGVVGNPGVVRLSRRTASPEGKNAWYKDENSSGGIILDLGIHDFDWLIWTFGDVERVMAKQVNKSSVNYALVTLRMRSGVIAHVELSWANSKLETSIEIAGDKGMITHNSEDSQPIKMTGPTSPMIGESPILNQLKHFRDCIVEGEKPIVTVEEAAKAVEVAQAALESAATGKPVYLEKKEALQ